MYSIEHEPADIPITSPVIGSMDALAGSKLVQVPDLFVLLN